MLLWGDFIGKTNFVVRPQNANLRPLRFGEIAKTNKQTNKQTKPTNKNKTKQNKTLPKK